MNRLDPTQFITKLSQNLDSMTEVEMRRAVSSLYFSLFNYWSEIKLCKLGEKGTGKHNDRFPLKEFSRDTTINNLSMEYQIIFELRVLCDHYTLNPNEIEITDPEVKKMINMPNIQIRLNRVSLEDAVDYAKSINKWLKSLL